MSGAGLRTLVLVAFAALSAAADGTAQARPGDATLTVFAASSLQESFRALGARFTKATGAQVRFSFAGSQELRTQLEQGAEADLFASADLRHAEALRRAGLALAPRTFATNTLVIAVPKGNPERVQGVADLARLKRLVIGAHEVPVGLYSEQLFQLADQQSPGLAAKLLARVSSRELNVRQVLAKVALGEADAGLVYRTDARAMSSQVDAVSLPPDLEQPADDVIEPLAHAPQPELAAKFVALLLSKEGQAELAADGFRPVPAP